MAIQDRTLEFRTCVDSIRNRSVIQPRTAEAKQRLLQSHGTAKTDFSRMASAIAKDISGTTIKLGKLAQRKCPQCHPTVTRLTPPLVAKRKTLFDDRPVEISVRVIRYTVDPLPEFYSAGTDIHHQTRYC